jgi:pilus assembly protein Flp/PilA
MRARFWKLLSRIRTLILVVDPNLIEYALLVALIAFSATIGAKNLASKIDTAYGNLGATFTLDIT